MADGQTATRRRRGSVTRATILDHAMLVASAEGLEGLSIGRLASELGISKSGLFAHFGSKQDLQLATIGAARDVYINEITRPASRSEAGLPRLHSLFDRYLSYSRRRVFPGGCFFANAASEFDGRPGPVRDAIAKEIQEWLDYLEQTCREAIRRGQLREDTDPRLLTFEIHALLNGANWRSLLFDDTRAYAMARRALADRLQALEPNSR